MSAFIWSTTTVFSAVSEATLFVPALEGIRTVLGAEDTGGRPDMGNLGTQSSMGCRFPLVFHGVLISTLSFSIDFPSVFHWFFPRYLKLATLVYLLSQLITNSPLEIETNSYFLRLLRPEAWCVFFGRWSDGALGT